MKWNLLCLIFCLFSTLWCDTTYVEGDTELWGIMEAENSPYVISGQITVPKDETLTIEPGCELRFTGFYKIKVDTNATLKAVGTVEDSIIFTRHYSAEESRWHGIRFRFSNANSILSYCRIEYATGSLPGSDNTGGGILIWVSDITVEHCTIRYNTLAHAGAQGCGIYVFESSPKINYNHIHHNVYPFNSGVSRGGGLYLTTSLLAEFKYNLIHHNSVNKTGGGIAMAWNSSPVLDHNTIIENYAGYRGGGISVVFGANPFITNSIIINNHCHDSAYADVSTNTPLAANYSIIGGYSESTVWDEDPLFVDPDMGNFQLQYWSPAIDKGDPDYEYDPDNSVTDIGATWYNHGIPLGTLGDINSDSFIDIFDIVIIIDAFLGDIFQNGQEFWRSDINGDLALDISDILLLIDMILGI